MDSYLLSLITFLPLAGAVVLLFLPKKDNLLKGVAFLFSLLSFGASLKLFFSFKGVSSAMQFVERSEWLKFGDFKIEYYLGVDGFSANLCTH